MIRIQPAVMTAQCQYIQYFTTSSQSGCYITVLTAPWNNKMYKEQTSPSPVKHITII